MKKILLLLILILSMLGVHAPPASAATPAEVAAAAEAAPAAVEVATDVSRVPFAAAELLYLPMGTGEIVLSPLPGVQFVQGVEHLGKGLIAPFKVGIALLRLPFNVLKHAGALLKVLPRGKL